MAEPMLVVEERAATAVERFREKFHPHHDYLTLIVPSTWLLFWIVVLDFYFYEAGHVQTILRRATALGPFFRTATPGLEFFLALILVLVIFTLMYVIGQMINGFSAIVLDRLIVKKLLKYPFGLYQRRLETDSSISDHSIFRKAMLESTYPIFCLNLLPFVFLELVGIAFTFRSTELPADAIAFAIHHPLLNRLVQIVISGFLVFMHFGWPSRRRARLYSEPFSLPDALLDRLVWNHVVLLVSMWLFEFVSITRAGIWAICGILLLPFINLVLGVIERRVPAASTPGQPMRGCFDYLRICFANPIYFAANLIGYGDFPSAALIRAVRNDITPGADSKDFFWLAYLVVQNRGEGASQTAYHFLATYGMVRNLCNATAFALAFSVASFLLQWPTNEGPAVVCWTIVLCVLMYALFTRYLYVYASYFSKYVLRAAAFAQGGRRVLLPPT